MCGIAGIVYKDKKLHCAGNDMTNMLHQLQHRGPDSAGYSIYGGTGLKDDEYILKIQVKEQPRLLETVKDTINFVTPIQSDEVLPSVGDSYRSTIVRIVVTRAERDVMVLRITQLLDLVEEIRITSHIQRSHA